MFSIPTPTPFAPAAPPVSIPSISLWDYAPTAVGWFNNLGAIANGARIVFFILTLIVALMLVMSLVRRMFDREDDAE